MDQLDKILIIKDLLQDITDKNEEINIIINKINDFYILLNDNKIDLIEDDFNQQLTILYSESLSVLSNYTSSFDDLDPSTWSAGLPKGLLLNNIPCLVSSFSGLWSNPPSNKFNIRGQGYLSDKVKVLSDSPLFHLRGIQIFRTQTFHDNIANQSWSGYPKHKHSNQWLILNYMIPGTFKVQIICYFTATQESLEVLKKDINQITAGWQLLLKKFWEGDKSFCDSRFKLIPHVVEGPWPIKMAVGQTPALTGKKLVQSYHKGSGYLEIGIDINSSSAATRILKMVRFQCKSIVVDLGITIQGEDPSELPERVLCQCRYNKVDFNNAEVLQL